MIKEKEKKSCPVQRALYFIEEFISGPMCGRCLICFLGSYEAMLRFKRITEGLGIEEDLFVLERIGKNLIEASMCKRGRETGQFIIEYIKNELFKRHFEGDCRFKECIGLVKYRIIPELCDMCGKCLEVCEDNAIIGEKRKWYLTGYLPFQIRDKRCTKCGKCINVCPKKAVEIVTISH